jgi:hypothetical protein
VLPVLVQSHLLQELLFLLLQEHLFHLLLVLERLV